MKKILIDKYFFFFIALLLSVYVLIVFVKNPGINGYERAMFPEMIYGTAWKPFVYRTLLPSAVRLTSETVPIEFHEVLTEYIESLEFGMIVLNKLNWESEYLLEYLTALVFMWLFLIGFVFAFRKLMIEVYYSPDWFSNLIPLLALLALPAMFQYYSYIYDFPTLFLFTSGLLLLLRQKWNYYLALFLIASFNKETVILLTLIFIIHFYKDDKMEKKLYYKLIAVQLLVFSSIKILLYFLFLDNPGSFTEFHLLDRNYLIFNGYSLTTFVICLIIIVSIFSNWDKKPKFLKNALWIAVPLLILTFFLGYLDELRDYYEVFPVIFLLIAQNIAKIIGIDLAPK